MKNWSIFVNAPLPLFKEQFLSFLRCAWVSPQSAFERKSIKLVYNTSFARQAVFFLRLCPSSCRIDPKQLFPAISDRIFIQRVFAIYFRIFGFSSRLLFLYLQHVKKDQSPNRSPQTLLNVLLTFILWEPLVWKRQKIVMKILLKSILLGLSGTSLACAVFIYMQFS